MRIFSLVIVLGVILFSMVLHELAHGLVALLLGDTTAKEDGRLTLNPLKHLDPVMSVLLPVISFLMGGVVFGGAKPVPVKFSELKGGVWGMALVALAGPLVNFLLALIAFLIGFYSVGFDGVTLGSAIVTEFMFINLGFGVFNLIPIPPLDGSRVLYVLMPDGVRSFMERIESLGIFIVYVLIVLGGGVFSSYMTGAMNGILFVFYWLVGM